MAETFGDVEAAEKIRSADTGMKAEEEMQKIKNFDENTWNQVKLKHWEDGQRLKFEQVRWIQSLLVYTDKSYLAVASQDKTWGTGWRKQRAESAQPRMWDGENLGGKALMKMRDHFKTAHAWMGPYEEQETDKKFQEMKKTYWRRQMIKRGAYGSRGAYGRGIPALMARGGKKPRRGSP